MQSFVIDTCDATPHNSEIGMVRLQMTFRANMKRNCCPTNGKQVPRLDFQRSILFEVARLSHFSRSNTHSSPNSGAAAVLMAVVMVMVVVPLVPALTYQVCEIPGPGHNNKCPCE